MSVAASLLVFGVSMHQPQNEDNREWLNPGLGIVLQHEYTRGLAGFYRNSYGDETLFAGVGGDIPMTKQSGVTLSALVATIYYEVETVRFHAALLPEAAAFFFEFRL